jgi:small subunit ribosomal protein S6
MFLLDAGQPSADAAMEPVQKILQRYGAEVLSIKPWDERRLAYEIEGRHRGLYILAYFRMDPQNVTEFEHDCKLSEDILRVLIIRKDHLTEEEINAETPASSGKPEGESRDESRGESQPGKDKSGEDDSDKNKDSDSGKDEDSDENSDEDKDDSEDDQDDENE